MEFSETFVEALSTLTLNKLRTSLAVLGIVIGIGSVIALISLGQGSQKAIENQINSLGANMLTINPGAQSSGPVRSASAVTTLTNDDATAIKTAIQTVAAVSPEVDGRLQLQYAKNNTNVRVNGVLASYAQVHKISVSSGVFISDTDEASMKKVVVLGPQTAADLFTEGTDPIGQTIRIKGMAFQVIGITTSKGGTGFQNQDDVAYIPLSVAQKQLFGQTYLNTISLEAKSSDIMVQAQDEVGYLLLARHKLTDPAKADFSIFSQADILNTASSTTSTFTTLLAGIAAISLFVGGIGIMNIMLVTVTERTREIGLRKALGAKKKTIITQFLTEAVILTFTGGFIGMLFGAGVSFVLSQVISTPFTLSGQAILLAVGVSGVIGVLFGWYPAQKAASLQPIEALRYE